MNRSASEIILNLENRVTRLEKQETQSRSKKAGRGYDDNEWVFFIHEDTGLEDHRKGHREAERLRGLFESCIDQLCDKHGLSICYDDGLSKVAFKAYASIAGLGTGLWDHDHTEAEMLEKLVKQDRNCGALAEKIENLPYEFSDLNRIASEAVDLRYVHDLAKQKLSNRNVVDVQRGKDPTGREMVSISLSNGVEINYSKYHHILMTTSTGDALDIGNPPHGMMNEQMDSDIAKYSRF